MDDDEQVRRKPVILLRLVLLDLRRGGNHHTIFNRERVEMEDVFQNELALFGRRLLEINPKKQVCVRQQGRHEKQLNVLRMQLPLGRKGKRPNHPLLAPVSAKLSQAYA